jgi:hypothetical protein
MRMFLNTIGELFTIKCVILKWLAVRGGVKAVMDREVPI